MLEEGEEMDYRDEIPTILTGLGIAILMFIGLLMISKTIQTIQFF